jgi:hypothetical protein
MEWCLPYACVGAEPVLSLSKDALTSPAEQSSAPAWLPNPQMCALAFVPPVTPQ